MSKFFVFSLALAALCSLAAQTQIFNQPYTDEGNAYNSTYNPAIAVDVKVADNFNGLADPISSWVFYGITGIYDDEWVPSPPNPIESFFVKFYAYEEESVAPYPGLVAPANGIYTVSLYDYYGDGWNGGMLDVYVNAVLVWDDLTLAGGYGPQDYTFSATAGDLIVTVFTGGNWSYENWYLILDPALAIIAQDSTAPGSDPPTGIGYIYEAPLTAPATGTYTVNIYETFGDGWNGAMLDVYVNGHRVLNGLDLSYGVSSASYTFPASAGDEISTIYTPGSWDWENWYEILLPDLNQMAQEGDASQTINPTSIGTVPHFMAVEPAWFSPIHSWLLNATTAYVADWNGWGLYKFVMDLPTPVAMSDGWISTQINCPGGSGQWFFWVSASGGDGVSYNHAAPVKGNPLPMQISPAGSPKAQTGDDMAFELWNEDGTVPVELSSFTALLTAENDVCLNWVTQSETYVSGYHVLRNTSQDAAAALLVSPLIEGTNTSEEHHYSFTDSEIFEPGTYYYWLQNTDFGGDVATHGPVSVNISAMAGEVTPELPVVTALQSIYPNPFNPLAIIPYSVAKTATVEIKVYNARGQLMRHFGLAERAPGNYQIAWDGKDANGHECGSGVYHFVMRAGSQTFQRKAVLLK